MSVSRLTLSPFFNACNEVFANVWGMRWTVNDFECNSATVKLTPSIAMDPLGTIPARSSDWHDTSKTQSAPF